MVASYVCVYGTCLRGGMDWKIDSLITLLKNVCFYPHNNDNITKRSCTSHLQQYS